MEPRSERNSRKNNNIRSSASLRVISKGILFYGLITLTSAVIGIGLYVVVDQSSKWTQKFSYLSDMIEKLQDEAKPLPTADPTSIDKPEAPVKFTPKVDHQPQADEDSVILESGTFAPVTLSFVGDILLGSNVERILTANGYDYPYTDVLDYLQQADIAVGNLETPITTHEQASTALYQYKSSPLALPALAEAGIKLVNLANNHVMDYGIQGLTDTLTALDQSGILHVGAGKDAQDAFQKVVIDMQGLRVAFLGFTHVVNDQFAKAGLNKPGVADTYNYVIPVQKIEDAKKEADLVIVLVHWGKEREDKPIAKQIELAHRFVDAGADLIVGSHPHVVQSFEQYKGKWIAYSLGNFIFTTNEFPLTWESVILQASCLKEGCDLQLVPILTKSAKPQVMTPFLSKRFFERLDRISSEAQIDEEGRITAEP